MTASIETRVRAARNRALKLIVEWDRIFNLFTNDNEKVANAEVELADFITQALLEFAAEQMECEFCAKELSELKGETLHGCLNCAVKGNPEMKKVVKFDRPLAPIFSQGKPWTVDNIKGVLKVKDGALFGRFNDGFEASDEEMIKLFGSVAFVKVKVTSDGKTKEFKIMGWTF